MARSVLLFLPHDIYLSVWYSKKYRVELNVRNVAAGSRQQLGGWHHSWEKHWMKIFESCEFMLNEHRLSVTTLKWIDCFEIHAFMLVRRLEQIVGKRVGCCFKLEFW